jgi:hypothetical protein
MLRKRKGYWKLEEEALDRTVFAELALEEAEDL